MSQCSFFQFDQQGNMYVFEPGAGCTGNVTLVKPGDELILTIILQVTLQENKYLKVIVLLYQARHVLLDVQLKCLPGNFV